MTETKFTPGPWEGKTVLVRGLNFLSHAHYPTELGVANAHLIAAAPELYEATTPLEVIGADRSIDSPEWRNQDCITVVISIGELRAIKAARAKARGEV